MILTLRSSAFICSLFLCYRLFVARFTVTATREQVKHCHADGDSVCDLIQNQRAAAVGNLGTDLDAAIHRSGMHHDGVGSSTLEMPRLQAVVNGILTHRGKECGVLSLALNPQNHHHVSAFDCVFKVFLNAQTAFDKFGEVVRHERARTADTDFRSELCE